MGGVGFQPALLFAQERNAGPPCAADARREVRGQGPARATARACRRSQLLKALAQAAALPHQSARVVREVCDCGVVRQGELVAGSRGAIHRRLLPRAP